MCHGTEMWAHACGRLPHQQGSSGPGWHRRALGACWRDSACKRLMQQALVVQSDGRHPARLAVCLTAPVRVRCVLLVRAQGLCGLCLEHATQAPANGSSAAGTCRRSRTTQLALACFIFLSMSVATLKMPWVGWSHAAHLPVFMLCLCVSRVTAGEGRRQAAATTHAQTGTQDERPASWDQLLFILVKKHKKPTHAVQAHAHAHAHSSQHRHLAPLWDCLLTPVTSEQQF